MKITKLGHCCLLIEEKGLRILTDPGNFSTLQNDVTKIDVIVITHEHADHYHIDSLRIVLKNNPQATIITNKAVGLLLDKEGIPFQLIEDGQHITIQDVLIEGYGEKHASIYPIVIPDVQNTGYFFAGRLFYPGDAYYNPKKMVEILALPVGGPWVKISEAVDYAKEIKPKMCFPVHDGMLKAPGGAHFVPNKVLTPEGIVFKVLEVGIEYEV